MSKQPTLYDLFNDDSLWGNQTAGDLSHEDIVDPRWNYKIAAKERMANAVTRKKLSCTISKKQNEKAYLDHMSQQRLEAMDKPIGDTAITLREKLTQANRKSAANPVHRANRTRANRMLHKDPAWIAAHKQACWESCGYAITTPTGEYPAMYEFDRKHNLRPGTCANYIKGLPHLFYKTEDGPGEPVYERVIYTPYGMFFSAPEAYKVAREQGNEQALNLNNIDNWLIKMCLAHPDEFYVNFEIAKYWHNESVKSIGSVSKKFDKDQVVIMQKKWQTRLEQRRSSNIPR